MDFKYYIRLHKNSFAVSKEDYVEYHRDERRIKYIREAEKKLGFFSYNSLDSNQRLGESAIADTSVDVEGEAIKNILLHKLRLCLLKLDADELHLIEQLIYQGKTEYELSKLTGIPQKTINNRKLQILAKLKRMIEK